MLERKYLVGALATMSMFGSVALAAEQTNKNAASEISKPSAANMKAEKDFGNLSADGQKAFQDIRLARLSIFDGRTDQAKKFVDEARVAMNKAKSDNTSYMKAETALKPPAGKSQPVMPQGGTDKTPTATTTPVAWLPIDGGLTLGEDFVESPAKAAGVAKANEQLKNGDHKQAMETLTLANIEVSFVMEVAPLDKSLSAIGNAAQLIESGKYYEGNQALKGIEDGIRFDVAEANDAPKKAADGGNKSGAAAPLPTSAAPASK